MKWSKSMAESIKAKVVGLAALALTNVAMAQTVPGGLTTAKNTASGIQTGVYEFVGVFAGIYLLYLAVMAKIERKAWADFGMGVVHVSLAGGAVVLAAWAWALFTS
jgi:hypothetical protein